MKAWLQTVRTRLQQSSPGSRIGFLLLAAGAFAVAGVAYLRSPSNSEAVPGDSSRPSFHRDSYSGEPVALNLNPDIVDGFRGEVSPLLHGRTNLEVAAKWVAGNNPKGNKDLLQGFRFYLEIAPAKERQTYTEREFSAFLPPTGALSEGQIWSLDSPKVAAMLRQFHPSPSMHMTGEGRRVGPDGAFGILRGVSPSHLDIAFRIHAEFDVTANLPRELPMKGWYAPACFTGHMLVNRAQGTVEYFYLGVPTDKALNVQLSMKPANFEPPLTERGNKSLAHFMARIDRMDLQGGQDLPAKSRELKDAMTQAEAQRKLQRVFYKFLDIEWLPFEKVLAAAEQKDKPILAVVLWGNLDDQSC